MKKLLKSKWFWITVGTAGAIGVGYWAYNKYNAPATPLKAALPKINPDGTPWLDTMTPKNNPIS